MSRKVFFLASAPILFSTLSLFAQTSNPPPSNPPQVRPGRGNVEPCWQSAGIEKSVMEQRWAIERDTHSQVSTVCSNTSLTPQQKQQQVRELRQQSKQKMDALMTPEQEKTLVACQQERVMNHPAGGMREGGGCGEWSRPVSRPGAGPNGNTGSNPPGGTASSPQN